MESKQKTARISGVLFLLSALTSAFHFLYVRPTVYLPKDATATIHNLIEHESLFRLGMMSVVFSQIFFLFLGFALHKLFYETNKVSARHLLIFIVMTVTLALANILTNFAALMMLSKADFLSAFRQEELNALAMMFLKLNNYGQGIVEIFWGFWFFTFGLLIIESKFIPKVIGLLMIVAGFSYLINIVFGLFFPQHHSPYLTKTAMLAGSLAALPTILWLIIKGIKEHTRTSKA